MHCKARVQVSNANGALQLSQCSSTFGQAPRHRPYATTSLLSLPCNALQLSQCANAFRQAPEVFAGDINAVCSFADFQANITTPRRGPLNTDPVLAGVAQNFSQEEAAQNFFDHYAPDGSNPYTRIIAVRLRHALQVTLLKARLSLQRNRAVRLRSPSYQVVSAVAGPSMCSAPHG